MSGFTSPNHTQCPNDLFDVHMLDMKEAELKVTLAIIRKTLGFHKKSDPISLSQLQKLTGLSRQAVSEGAADAIERGLVEIVGTGKRGVLIYGLVINSDQSIKETTTSQENRPVTSLKSRHTKETEQKKPLQKKIKENAPDGATSAQKPKKVSYPSNAKSWEWKHLEQYACENPTIELLAAFNGMGAQLKSLPTAGVARDAVELFKELNRNKVPPDRWQSLHEIGLKNKYDASIFKRMLWALERWLKTDAPITIVKPDDDMPKPTRPVIVGSEKSA